MNNLWVKFGDANGVKWPLVPNLARLFLSPNPPVPPPSKPHTDNTAAPEGSFADGQCGRITDFDLGAVSRKRTSDSPKRRSSSLACLPQLRFAILAAHVAARLTRAAPKCGVCETKYHQTPNSSLFSFLFWRVMLLFPPFPRVRGADNLHPVGQYGPFWGARPLFQSVTDRQPSRSLSSSIRDWVPLGKGQCLKIFVFPVPSWLFLSRWHNKSLPSECIVALG